MPPTHSHHSSSPPIYLSSSSHTPEAAATEMGIRDAEADLNLPPGFRFHPTDEELVVHYLCRRAAHQRLPVSIIAEVDLYKFDPWDLPEKALFGEKEWYFFTPRDRKYPNGSRPNRAAGRGYWKATGADKPVSPPGYSRPVGIKKALVFYNGKAPKGVKTDWIMHEYRLADTNRSAAAGKSSIRLDEWVLCRLYNKKNAWERTRPASSVVESMESDSLRTPESDVDHGSSNSSFPDLDLGQFTGTLQAGGFPMMAKLKEEEDNDWFTGLNLDDLQTTFMSFGSAAAPSIQDYYFHSSQGNLPPF